MRSTAILFVIAFVPAGLTIDHIAGIALNEGNIPTWKLLKLPEVKD